MLAVLQAEGAQLLQRHGHAQCSRIREPVTAIHVEVLQAPGQLRPCTAPLFPDP